MKEGCNINDCQQENYYTNEILSRSTLKLFLAADSLSDMIYSVKGESKR